MKTYGNSLFKDQKYKEAVIIYGEALKSSPYNHMLYSNRAFAYLKLEGISSSYVPLIYLPDNSSVSFSASHISSRHANEFELFLHADLMRRRRTLIPLSQMPIAVLN